VVHGLWADEAGAVAVLAAWMLRIPSAVSVMGGELAGIPDIAYGGRLSRVSRLLSGFCLRAASAVTAASGTAPLRDGSDPSWQRLIWGVDPQAFHESDSGVELEGSFRVLQVGSLVAVKDPFMMIQAMAHLRRSVPGAHLHLVGDGPMRPYLKTWTHKVGVPNAVTFHGHVERHLLGAYYRAADVLAVSSRHEMQPVVALEAALFGLPVIGTQVGLMPDLAVATVPVGDARGLAVAIEGYSFEHGRDMLRRRRAALHPRSSGVGSNGIGPEFLASHTAGQLTSLYESLTQQHRRRAKRLRRTVSTSSLARRRKHSVHPSKKADAHD
jgi:glycosyltransferase involved in cell wall biosynthesis